MADRLPAAPFLALAVLFLSFAQFPLLRYALGLDAVIVMPPSSMAMLTIGGLMCGLTAMILMARREAAKPVAGRREENPSRRAVYLHACGLLIFTGVPLANFLAGYWLWKNYRRQSQTLHQHGLAMLNFQISMYLYLLLSAFLVFIVIGLLTTPILLLFHLLATLYAMTCAWSGRPVRYPLSIEIAPFSWRQD